MLDLKQIQYLAVTVTERLNKYVESRGEEECFMVVPYSDRENSNYSITLRNYIIFDFATFDPEYGDRSWEQQIIDELKLNLHKLQKTLNIALTY